MSYASILVPQMRTSRRSSWKPSMLPSIFAAFDFKDPLTLDQSSSGGTPVTVLGHPIGLTLDVSGQGRHMTQNVASSKPTWGGIPTAYGSELVTNGGFATDSDWTKGTGVTISGGVAIATAAPNGSTLLSQSIALTALRLYEINFTVLNRTSGQFNIRFNGGTAVATINRTANATYRFYLRAESGNNAVAINNSGTGDAQFDNVSVREVTAVRQIGLLNDGIGDLIRGLPTVTISTPCYLAFAITRPPVDIGASNIGAWGTGSGLRMFYGHTTAGRVTISSAFADAGFGTTTTNGSSGGLDNDDTCIVELMYYGPTHAISINGGTDTSAATTAPGAISFVNPGHYLASNGVSGVPGTFVHHAAVLATAVPSAADRALVRGWLTQRAGTLSP